ncbi:MAG TPA: sigma-70 family RNA polymerase sigma factor [Acidimicrobiales bacterium]|nr:sigma-70 family RNA polymerase sigma factor [Acidimicrobiales bacterium]
MTDQQWLAERFEEQRPRLRAVAYRMLGSLSEADDAVQDTWLRVSRADASVVENLGGWLTTVVARVSLNLLRSRATRQQEPLDVHLPDPVIDAPDRSDPEHEALLADSVGLAMLVVLDALSPAERLAFVLHDMFAVPFEEIAAIVGRSPEATRQLASRARRRVQGSAPVPDADLDTQWKVLDAFAAAARDGDFEALVSILDPDVVLRADGGQTGLSHVVHGAAAVASQATMWARADLTVRRALVNGAAGMVAERDGKPFSVGAFTVRKGRIVECDILVDPERVGQLDLEMLQD